MLLDVFKDDELRAFFTEDADDEVLPDVFEDDELAAFFAAAFFAAALFAATVGFVKIATFGAMMKVVSSDSYWRRLYTKGSTLVGSIVLSEMYVESQRFPMPNSQIYTKSAYSQCPIVVWPRDGWKYCTVRDVCQ